MWMVVGPAVGGALAACLVGALIGPLSETVRLDLDFGPAMRFVVVLIHLGAVAVGLLPGWVFGLRWTTRVAGSASVLIVLGILVMALAGNGILVFIGSVFIGLGGGAVAGTAFGLAGQAGQRRTGMLVAIGAAVFAGLLCGLALAWSAVIGIGWHEVYFLALPVGLLSLAITGISGLVAALTRNR